jgi:hypothetical protein
MRKIAALVAAGALSMSAFAGVASAHGNAYGKTIKDECGYSFGQLRQLAKANPAHPSVTPSKGAKYFVQNTLASHCR